MAIDESGQERCGAQVNNDCVLRSMRLDGGDGPRFLDSVIFNQDGDVLHVLARAHIEHAGGLEQRDFGICWRDLRKAGIAAKVEQRKDKDPLCHQELLSGNWTPFGARSASLCCASSLLDKMRTV